MMTDAANEKIVRRDMITVLPRLPKNVSLPQERSSLRRCFVDLDQPRHIGTAGIRSAADVCQPFR
jgi:hypothetical protein